MKKYEFVMMVPVRFIMTGESPENAKTRAIRAVKEHEQFKQDKELPPMVLSCEEMK